MLLTDEGKLTNTGKRMVAIITIGGFITALNQLVMSPALPSIMAEFRISAATGQWLTSIFLLVNGLMVPITAYLISRFSSRQLFTFAMLAFTAGSVVDALSDSFATLMLGRVMQALGAGVMMPLSMVLLMWIFPKERRGFAMGLSGVIVGLAPAFGPTFAGYMVDTFGWRYIFACIAPLAAIVCLIALKWLKNIGEQKPARLDWLSVIMSTVAFGGLLLGFSMAGSIGWLAPLTIVSIAVGAAVLILFARRQLRREEPLLNLRTLKNPKFAVSAIVAATVSAGLTIGAVLTPIYLQNVQGISALNSGLILMPGAVIMAGMTLFSGAMFDRIGPRVLGIIGFSVMAGGSFMLSLLGPHSSILYVCTAYSLRSLGIAFANMPINTWGINQLPNSLIAHGNAISNTARQVGGSMGTAILVTIMTIAAANSGLREPAATTHGINVAFGITAIIFLTLLVLTIVKVKGGGYGKNN